MNLKKMLAAVMLGVMMLSCEAETTAQTVSARVASILGVKPASVAKKPFGLWEVVLSADRVIYVDDGVRHAFTGSVIDLKTMQNLTEARVRELSRIDWKTLPLGDALKVVHGSGKYKVAVFADATCMYCKKLEDYFAKMGDVTVYTFVFPMRNSRAISRDVICSKDAPRAWTELMTRGVKPAAGSCDDSVLERNAALSRKLGVSGTPTLFFPSGERLGGVPSLEDLKAILRKEG